MESPKVSHAIRHNFIHTPIGPTLVILALHSIYTMVEYFVPIFSINVIRSVFWGEFYITIELSHAKCLSTAYYTQGFWVFLCIYRLYISGISAQFMYIIAYKIHPKCNCFVITLYQLCVWSFILDYSKHHYLCFSLFTLLHICIQHPVS